MKRLLKNKRGTLFSYMVLIAALIIGCVVAFLLMTVISHVQETFGPALSASHWVSADLYMAYYYAATFITNFWQYIIAFVIIVMAYWLYIYNQRRSAGY